MCFSRADNSVLDDPINLNDILCSSAKGLQSIPLFYFLHYLLLLPICLLNKRIIKEFSGLALLNSVLCIPTKCWLAVHSWAFSVVILTVTLGWYKYFVSILSLDKINLWGVALWPPPRSKSCKTEIRGTCFKLHLSTSHFLESDKGSSGNKYMKKEKENDRTFYTCREIEFIFSCDWYIIITGVFCLPLTVWIWSFCSNDRLQFSFFSHELYFRRTLQGILLLSNRR